jgi:hypothetical protein
VTSTRTITATYLDNNTDITAAFTDANFLARVRLETGITAPDPIRISDVSGITSLNVNSQNISSLAGIQYFTSLTLLDCSYNQLTTLDVSNNIALVQLWCNDNNLTSLNVSNTALTTLWCHNNNMTSPNDVTGVPALLAGQINDASGSGGPTATYRYFPQSVLQNAFTITTQPAPTTTVIEGSISGTLSVAINNPWGFTPTYQWFSNTTNSNTGGTPVGTNSPTFTIPTNLNAGTAYYYVVISAPGVEPVTSNVATVTIISTGEYSIELYWHGPITEPLDFGRDFVGYTSGYADTVFITNTGSMPTGPLDVTLSGQGASGFTIVTPVPIGSIEPGETGSFYYQVNENLPAGFYEATITVSGTNINATVITTFRVVSPSDGIELNKFGTYVFDSQPYGYDVFIYPHILVSNIGNQPTGTLIITLSGPDAGSFYLSEASIASIAENDSDVFLVSYKEGLSAGTYTATVTVSGANVVSQSFNVSFTVTPQ